MPGVARFTRGLVVTTALAFCICACTPPPDSPPPPRTLDAATNAISAGDVNAWLEHTGKGDGLLHRARTLMAELEPLTWLAALGCLEREHDLQAAHDAVAADDHDALLAALGLSRQLVAADLLQAGDSIEVRRAQSKDHFTVGEPPLAVLRELPPLPDLGSGVLAWHATLQVAQPDRVIRVRIGRDAEGLTDLRVGKDLAGVTRRPGVASAPTVQELLGAPELAPWLELPGLRRLRVIEVSRDGATRVTEVRRESEDLLTLLEDRRESLVERLEAARDGNLLRLQAEVRRAISTRGRYPEMLEGHTTRLVDPAAPNAALGWALYAGDESWFELLRTPELVIRTRHRYTQGHRAIQAAGQPYWEE
jgi:hypothetical protein